MNKVWRFSIPFILACIFLGGFIYLMGSSSQVVASSGSHNLVRIDRLAQTQSNLLVTTIEDELNNDGDCSLREAIEAANSNTSVDACGSGDVLTDTIKFDLAGTLTLTTQLSVTAGGPLVINGGEVITISGDSKIRVWWVEAGSELTLSNLSIFKGFDMTIERGGGLYNLGAMVNIINCNFLNNDGPLFGGAIYNEGLLKINHTIFMDNHSMEGGAIFNQGTVAISESTFSGNGASHGGAIDNNGVLTMTNSTIFANNAYYGGGGIYNWVTMTITNSTISGNSVDLISGGGISNQGNLSINNSTFSGNSANIGQGGGISTGPGNVHLINTIIANSLSGSDCAIYSGTIIDGGHNIDSDGSCGLNPANGSLPNTNPLLGPLLDTGGPTLTHALLEGSPAIDAGDDTQCPPSDQRGVPRPQDGNGDSDLICDIGSYEYAPGYLIVTSLEDDIQSNSECTLREALEAANKNTSVDTCGTGIVLTDTIIFNVEGIITITNQLSVTAGGPLVIDGGNVITTSGDGKTRVWWIDMNGDMILQNITVSDGYVEEFGAGLNNHQGHVTLNNSTFSYNHAYFGGAVGNNDDLSVINCTFFVNYSSAGGGISNWGSMTITNSTFSGNIGEDAGGGIDNWGNVTIVNSLIVSNSIQGIYGSNIFGDAILINTIVANNEGGNCYGDITDGGHNISSDETCEFSTENDSMPSTDPLLGYLQDNGGPTWTHALLPGSPAIDAGDNAQCPSTDQRGEPRPVDGNKDGMPTCDIGSFEYQVIYSQRFYLPIISK